MAIHTSTTAANAQLDAVTALLSNGYIRIYDGTRPANANTPISGNTLLAELRYATPAFPAASSASSTANSISAVTCVATGTASWFRCLKSDGTTVVFDGNVGTSGSDCNFNTTSFAVGAAVSLTSVVLTQTL